jgi:hypothetical protein
MLKLRKGIELPIIPEDFIAPDQETHRDTREPSFAPAKRILPRTLEPGKGRPRTGKRKR